MKLKKIGKWFLIVNVAILALGFVLPAFGAKIDLSFADPNAGLSKSENPIGDYVQNFYTFALWISGALAMLMIVAGGIRYTTSAGKPDVQNDAKDMIFSALWGVVLLFGAVLILNTVNPALNTLSVSRKSLGPAANCTGNTYYCVPQGKNDDEGSCVNTCPLNTKRDALCGECVAITIDCPATVTTTSDTGCPGVLILNDLLTNNPNQIVRGVRRAFLLSGISGINFSVGGHDYRNILAGITNNNTESAKYYNEDELLIPKYSMIWTYPYYIGNDSIITSAKCVIYAFKKPSLGARCDSTTGFCNKYEPTEKTDLNKGIIPC